MSRDVLISHSHEDHTIAKQLCDVLESKRIRCWIAPRDIQPGDEWAKAIAEAIPSCKILVLIHSKAANESKQVEREVGLAAHYGLVIVPFRTENVQLSKALEYHISSCQWYDATEPPMDEHIQRLADKIHRILSGNGSGSDTPKEVYQLGVAYRMGFTFAKVIWHHGDEIQRDVLRQQVEDFSRELSLPDSTIARALSTIKPATSASMLIANAKNGITIRNSIASLIETRLGSRSAAAFRLGFGIVHLMPQFEILSMGLQAGMPIHQIITPMEAQIAGIVEDAKHIHVSDDIVSSLDGIVIDAGRSDVLRMELVVIGTALDRELNGNG